MTVTDEEATLRAMDDKALAGRYLAARDMARLNGRDSATWRDLRVLIESIAREQGRTPVLQDAVQTERHNQGWYRCDVCGSRRRAEYCAWCSFVREGEAIRASKQQKAG